MDAQQAARRLGITPRVLRRIVRKHSTLQRAGMGGRYDFTEEDIREIENIMANRKKADGIAALDQSPGLPLELVQKSYRDPNLRALVLEHRREREQRLASRLAELGGNEGLRKMVKAMHEQQRAER